MTEAAIDAALHRDIFIALGQSLGGDAWSVRVRVKPLISFLWIGAVVIALGGLIAVTDRRHRVQPAEQAERVRVAPVPRPASRPAEGH